jgi:regulator of cell morphogenesis and NO signaling
MIMAKKQCQIAKEKPMSVITEKTVRELVVENPNATRVFEKLGIDYCCGGNKSLEEACRVADLPVDEVLHSLELAGREKSATSEEHDWRTASLAGLIAHITNTHHKYTREEMARLTPLFDKVCSVHGKNHPELLRLRTGFHSMGQEMTMHMMKEEKVLFPYIVKMEQAATQRSPLPPPPFGNLQHPVAMMEREHDFAGNALCNMRETSSNYTSPPDACITYQTLYRTLGEFEADMHQHISLENNILFPRAIAIEAGK